MASDLSLQRSNFGNLGSVLASLQQGASNDETMNIQANTQYLDIQAQLKGVAQSGFGDLAFGAYELLGQSKALYGRFNTARESIAKLPDTLKATLQKGVDKQLQNYEDIKDIGQRAVAGGEDLVNETRSGAEALAQSARDAAAGIQTTVERTAADIQTTVGQTAADIQANLGRTAADIGSNVRDTIQSVQTDVQRTAGEIQTNIGQTAAELRSTAEQTANGIRSTVEETAAQVRTNISGLTFDARGIPQIRPEDDIFSETFRPPTLDLPRPRMPDTVPSNVVEDYSTARVDTADATEADFENPIMSTRVSQSIREPFQPFEIDTPPVITAPPVAAAPVRSRVAQTVANEDAILPAPRPSAAPSLPVERPAIQLPEGPIETRDINPNRTRGFGDTAGGALPPETVEPVGTALTSAQASRGTSSGLADTLRPDANPQQSMLDFDPERFTDPRLTDIFEPRLGGITASPYKQLTDLQDVGSKSMPFDTEMKDMISGFTGKQKIALPEAPTIAVPDVPALGGNVRATVSSLEEQLAAFKPGGSLPTIGGNTTEQVAQLGTKRTVRFNDDVQNLVDQTTQRLKGSAAQVQSTVEQTGAQVQSTVEQTGAQVQGAAQQVGAQVQQAVEQTGAQVQGAAQQAAQEVQGAIERTSSQVQGAAQRTGEQLQSAVEQTGAQVEGATQRVGEQIQTTLQEVQNRAGGVLTQGEELVSQTASKATSLVTETTQALQGAATKVISDATETALEVGASVLPVVGEVAEVAMGAFQIYEGFKDLFHGPTAAPPPPTIVPQVANIASSFQSGI